MYSAWNNARVRTILLPAIIMLDQQNLLIILRIFLFYFFLTLTVLLEAI